MANKQRTDAHRPGALIPAHYEDWNSYSLATTCGGWPIPRIGVDCSDPIAQHDGKGRITGYTYPVCKDTGRCCVASTERHARAAGCEVFGSAGRCGVCGAHFGYGTMFKHEPTGEIVHMGHDCANKYGAMYDLSAWEIENGRIRSAAAKHIKRTENDRARAKFLDEHPGLADAFTVEHRIIADIHARFVQWHSISDKQIALVMKLANEVRNPAPPKPEELRVTAPTGKGVEFEGEIVSAKLSMSEQYGSSWKITVRVQTDAGSWLAWGTCPSNILELVRGGGSREVRTELIGLRLAVKSTLERPAARDASDMETDVGRAKVEQRNRETHFVFMRRPSATIAGLYDHPVRGKARKSKAKKEVTEAPCGVTE
jgi:hypothetical protein